MEMDKICQNEAKKVETSSEVLTEIIKRRIEEEQKWVCDTQVALENNLKSMDAETSGFLNGVKYACTTLREFIDKIDGVRFKEI